MSLEITWAEEPTTMSEYWTFVMNNVWRAFLLALTGSFRIWLLSDSTTGALTRYLWKSWDFPTWWCCLWTTIGWYPSIAACWRGNRCFSGSVSVTIRSNTLGITFWASWETFRTILASINLSTILTQFKSWTCSCRLSAHHYSASTLLDALITSIAFNEEFSRKLTSCAE